MGTPAAVQDVHGSQAEGLPPGKRLSAVLLLIRGFDRWVARPACIGAFSQQASNRNLFADCTTTGRLAVPSLQPNTQIRSGIDPGFRPAQIVQSLQKEVKVLNDLHRKLTLDADGQYSLTVYGNEGVKNQLLVKGAFEGVCVEIGARVSRRGWRQIEEYLAGKYGQSFEHLIIRKLWIPALPGVDKRPT
jgi:hypothetical protein